MAAWRRKAIELFPQLKLTLNDPEFTLYMLYFDLLPMVHEAHETADKEMLDRIYSYAEWCLHHRELSNAAAVAFYEHLFDSHPTLWEKMIGYMSPFVIQQCLGLWEYRWESWGERYKNEHLPRLKRLLDQRRKGFK